MAQAREVIIENNSINCELGASRSAFVSRLHTILRQWPSVDRLARAMQVSPSAFRKWLKGEAEPSRERLVALAEAAKVNIAWLAAGEGPDPAFPVQESVPRRGRAAEPVEGIDFTQFALLPRRPEGAAAGAGLISPPSMVPRSMVEYMAFRHDWIASNLGVDPEALALEIAVGDSMMPTIRNGDTLFIDTSDKRFCTSGIYVLVVEGQRLVKRVQRKLDGSVRLISDNPSYEPEVLPPDRAEQIAVVGRLIWRAGAV
jgi:phage repressor protein C with HTH and peptisase S24 domain